MQKLILALLSTGFLLGTVSAAEVEPIEHPAVSQILENLPHQGILMQRERDGLIYLKVSEEYLDQLFPILQEVYGDKGLVKGSSTEGAHCSVIRPSMGEPVFRDIPELDEVFDFVPLRLATIVPDLDSKWERVWILEISSPSLEELRVAYGLSPRVGNTDNEFHITIGTKLKE